MTDRNQRMRAAVPVPLLGKQILVRSLIAISVSVVLISTAFLTMGFVPMSHAGLLIFRVFLWAVLTGIPSSQVIARISIRYAPRLPVRIHLLRIVLQLMFTSMGLYVAEVIFVRFGLDKPEEFWGNIYKFLPFGVFFSITIGYIMFSIALMRYRLYTTTLELRTRQLEQERFSKLLAEARLSSLESRIHPHFLFNTLNSIAALIPIHPQKAENTVEKLASLLRFSLSSNRSRTVALSQELKIVNNFLEIEKTRFEARLRYQIEVPEELHEAQLPPLALQTLVENAIKHVVAKRSEGASIFVQAHRIEDEQAGCRICLEVRDDGPGFSLDSIHSDHGLGNLAGRLDLLYGKDGELRVDREGEETVVRMIFPPELQRQENA